jgi:Novel STAND NTPase 3
MSRPRPQFLGLTSSATCDLLSTYSSMGTSKYNLEHLGWYNFEQLARTLMRAVIGNGLSTFGGSVDQGRDATFSGRANSFPSAVDPWTGEWIFQVKHRMYSTRGAATVRDELKRILPDEVTRILQRRRNVCDNYVAITNCPLTATDKDELTESIRTAGPEIGGVAVLGESDLQEHLDNHPRVVSAFPQILGLSQLRELVQWGLHRRSREYLEAAQSEISTFVATNPYLQAIDLLHKQHFCVLAGPPKMGKTCTAYALAASFAAMQYEVFDLRSQKDFHEAYRDDQIQLFICDDVFGDISLQITQRDDWTRGFLRLLQSLGPKHKLVWTARSYILTEAINSSRLGEERPELVTTDTVTVAVDQLSRLEKAMILYNHAREAKLPEEVRRYLQGEACIRITDHSNYSPESIRQLCTGRLVAFAESASGDTGEIDRKVEKFLAAPGEAWKKAYLAAPPGERMLCTEVMASGGAIRSSELQRRYENAISGTREVYQPFESSMAGAQGTFLRRRPFYRNDDLVQFYHPSMRDLLRELVETDVEVRRAYLQQLALTELPAVTGVSFDGEIEGSDAHRIVISEDSDIDLLRDHIQGTLLPAAELSDVLSVIGDLIRAVKVAQKSAEPRNLRKSPALGKVFWMVLDLVVPYACRRQFWLKNSETADVAAWRRMFEHLRLLLPIVSTPVLPEYVPELLRRRKMDISVDYWGLVAAAEKLAPTIVEQSVDLREREKCRCYLVERVGNALTESEDMDLENCVDDSQRWHDEYYLIRSDSEDYAKLFPADEEIGQLAELCDLMDNFPRLSDPEGEGEDYSSLRSSERCTDEQIIEVFSDL